MLSALKEKTASSGKQSNVSVESSKDACAKNEKKLFVLHQGLVYYGIFCKTKNKM